MVLIVGAGLAGLRCAQVLTASGVDTLLLEAADRPGGRVASDVVDGFVVDRGFQLLNPAYPQAKRALDLDRLDLRAFAPGALIVGDSGRTRLADPLRRPLAAPGALFASLGTFKGRVALGRLLATLRFRGPTGLLRDADRPALEWLGAHGVDEPTAVALLDPFLTGVVLEQGLTCSGHLVALLLTSFVRGTPAVPARGMGAIPAQMVGTLPPTSIRCGTPVERVAAGEVHLVDGEVCHADSVVLATDPTTASRLLAGVEPVEMRGVTTMWFASPAPAATGATLVLDATASPIVNAVDMTAAAPSYAPPTRHLFAASLLGEVAAQDHATIRERVGELLGVAGERLVQIAASSIPAALPATRAPLDLLPALSHDGVLLAGDHVATPSIQGALASGERAARAIVAMT